MDWLAEAVRLPLPLLDAVPTVSCCKWCSVSLTALGLMRRPELERLTNTTAPVAVKEDISTGTTSFSIRVRKNVLETMYCAGS